LAKKRPSRKVEYFSGLHGEEPFWQWFESSRLPRNDRVKIRVRLRKIDFNDFGDHKELQDADGVCELRCGQDYRVYYGEDGRTVIILTGGDKTTQQTDIEEAKFLWKYWKENK